MLKPNFIDFRPKMGMLCMNLNNNPVGRRMRKVFICTPQVHPRRSAIYVLYFGPNVCVKFQIPSYKGSKVGIFRISPIIRKSDMVGILYSVTAVLFPHNSI